MKRTFPLASLSPFLIGLAVASSGCALFGGGGALTLPPVTAPTVTAPGISRTITTLTDLDTVRDVSVSVAHVYVATDNGVLVYDGEGESVPTRLTTAEGLPSNDVLAITSATGGVTTAATSEGLVELENTQVSNPVVPPAPVGDVVALHSSDDGTTFACGTEGLAKRDGSGWSRVGEPSRCTGLFGTPEGHLYVGTTRGLLYLEGDIVREHARGRGLAGAYIRDVVPGRDGKVFALASSPTESFLAYYDGERWVNYTIDEFDRLPVGLGTSGADMVLVTAGYHFKIEATDQFSGVRLKVLSRGEPHSIRSYRARITPASDVRAASDDPDSTRPLSRLAPYPANHPSYAGQRFVISPLESGTPGAYLVKRAGGRVFVADRNRGVLEITQAGKRALRSRDLVATKDLQIASDTGQNTFILTERGGLGIMRANSDGFVRLAAPEGASPQALATGPNGVYLAALVNDQPNVVRVYKAERAANGSASWAPHLERTLSIGGTLAGVAFVGVADDLTVWAGVRVQTEGDASRMRGLAVMNPNNDDVLYHFRGAAQVPMPELAEGEIAPPRGLEMPDEVETIDLGESGMAWFASIYGGIRIGNSQAVVFGEARGVRGEVVSDVAVGDQGRIWFAAAEGPGYYFNNAMEFRMPEAVRSARPVALAVDQRGDLWGAGPNGMVHYDGANWNVYGEAAGLPASEYVDIEVDGKQRLFVLGSDRVVMLSPTE